MLVLTARFRPLLLCTALLAASTALSGCALLAFGAGAGTVAVVSEERSTGAIVDDNKIFLHLKSLYAKSENNDMFGNVSVKVNEGVVVLTGNVDKPETQVEASRLAWTVPGVKEVHDELTVNDKSSFWNYSRDVIISNQIRARLLATKGIRSINYSVVTVNQVVYLTGIAQDQAELDRVTYVASTTNYVQRVVSYVRLKDDPRRTQSAPAS